MKSETEVELQNSLDRIKEINNLRWVYGDMLVRVTNLLKGSRERVAPGLWTPEQKNHFWRVMEGEKIRVFIPPGRCMEGKDS